MSSTPEGKVKKEVNKLLKHFGVYKFMPVQAGYGKPGLDYHCIYRGLAMGIETKAPGKKLTPRQELTKSEVEEAGGPVFVIGEEQYEDGSYSGMEELRAWLQKHS